MPEQNSNAGQPRVVKGMPSVELSREEFARRFRERYLDPAFDAVEAQLDAVIDVAWRAYIEYRKSPRTRRAGAEFADPDYELSVEWLATREAIRAAERGRNDAAAPSRVLLVNASAEATILAQQGFEVDFLDLSRLVG
jgi:hypothetical protein